MDSRTLFVALSNLAFAGVCGVVAVRLLRMAWRTRKAPELCVGTGLFGLIVSIPLMTYAGFGRLAVSEVRMGAAAVALAVLSVGSGFIYAFTWKAFRPRAVWAVCLVAGCTALTAAISIGAYRALATAAGEASSFDACGGWLASLYYPMGVSFIWTATEGFREWTRARRRMKIGLGDRVVANRFLLWGLIGAISASNSALGLYLHHLGLSATKDPIVAAISSVGGIASAALLWLTFMPPSAYLRRIRGAATAS